MRQAAGLVRRTARSGHRVEHSACLKAEPAPTASPIESPFLPVTNFSTVSRARYGAPGRSGPGRFRAGPRCVEGVRGAA